MWPSLNLRIFISLSDLTPCINIEEYSRIKEYKCDLIILNSILGHEHIAESIPQVYRVQVRQKIQVSQGKIFSATSSAFCYHNNSPDRGIIKYTYANTFTSCWPQNSVPFLLLKAMNKGRMSCH